MLALECRQELLHAEPDGALRLLNGFYEAQEDLVIDRFSSTIVIFNHGYPPENQWDSIREIQAALLKNLPGISCILVKTRRSTDTSERQGRVTFGDHPAELIVENGVRYSLDLLLNQDASFYIDTRNLRTWLKDRAAGWHVLNCFAYTGSLGVAALAGGAARVNQLDLSNKFLSVAKKSYRMNGFPVAECDFLVGDFFRLASKLRRGTEKFDCVVLDAPFFSSGARSTIITQQDTARLINKVRPLVREGGCLVTINNSLFLSGRDYLDSLDNLGRDGCLEVEEIIPVPEDITGMPQTIVRESPVNPAPFNHPTKIAILRVKNKNRVAPV
jgi:23S rRNA (cytosine1962-C5)-methyltransferase